MLPSYGKKINIYNCNLKYVTTQGFLWVNLIPLLNVCVS